MESEETDIRRRISCAAQILSRKKKVNLKRELFIGPQPWFILAIEFGVDNGLPDLPGCFL